MTAMTPASTIKDAGQITQTLASYVVNSELEEIPSEVQREGLRSILTWIGCAIGGSRHKTVEIAVASLLPFTNDRSTTLIGRTERLDPLNAAMVNGMSSIVLDFDASQYKKTNIHPSGPVLPPLLALAEHQTVCGRELLHAYLLGIEIEGRLANEIFGRPDNPGWHVTGAVGPVGAAAATGRLLGLSTEQMVYAFGIAATQMGGLREMYGTMCKSFTPGRAAQNGMLAAMLAKNGFDSARAPIEGSKGLARVLMNIAAPESLVANLGTAFEISYNAYKPYACAIVCHAAIDACQRLRARYQLTPADVRTITVKVPPQAIELAGNPSPQTGLESKFSVSHAVALALSYDDVAPKHFSDQLARDPLLVASRDRVIVVPVATMRKDQAEATIETSDGRTLSERVDHAIGSLQNPLPDAGIERKFRQLSEDVIGAERSQRLIDLCWSLPSLLDVKVLIREAQAE